MLKFTVVVRRRSDWTVKIFEKCLSSRAGACPGDDETAGVNYSHRSPKGNRYMRRLLNQAANAAARSKGSIFEILYRAQSRVWDTIKPSGPSHEKSSRFTAVKSGSSSARVRCASSFCGRDNSSLAYW
jgi:hypothetical protein